MRRFVPIAGLALVWVALTGSPTLLNVLLGLALGALSVSLSLVNADIQPFAARWRMLKVARLVLYFLKELLLSAWRVAHIVTRRRLDIAPGILAFPLTVTRDFEITLLAHMITLTPGTLSVDVSEDRRTLYVHAIDCFDPDATRRAIADGFERRVMEAFR